MSSLKTINFILFFWLWEITFRFKRKTETKGFVLKKKKHGRKEWNLTFSV